jgi:4-hydroxybenzoate polyprenyltransferase
VHNPDPERRLTESVVASVVLGSLCAALMNAASNALNQITDLEIDRINKPDRPLVTGALSIREAWAFVFVGYTLALLPTWLVVPYPYETWSEKARAPWFVHQTFYLYLAGLIFTLIYSLPMFGRTKSRGMWANWTIAIPRGGLLKVAGWAMVADVRHVEPWALGAVFLLFLVGASSTKDFADMEGDRLGGCRTLPVLYGPEIAARKIAPYFVFPWLLVPVLVWFPDPLAPEHPILTGHPGVLAVLGLGLAAWGAYTVRLLLRDPASLAKTENHPSWQHMYWMMMTAQVGFALAYLWAR